MQLSNHNMHGKFVGRSPYEVISAFLFSCWFRYCFFSFFLHQPSCFFVFCLLFCLMTTGAMKDGAQDRRKTTGKKIQKESGVGTT